MRALSVRQTVAMVARHYGWEPADLYGDSRGAQVTWARHVAYYVLREARGMGWREIGRVFGKDHQGVIHGARRVALLVERAHLEGTERPFADLIAAATPKRRVGP